MPITTSSEYQIGFSSQNQELDKTELPVTGKLPSWLSGTLLRNGPAQFEAGQSRLNHWFDGFSMLSKFEIAEGKVFYSNKFLKTKAYTQAIYQQQLTSHEFATNPHESLWTKVKSIVAPPLTDNANVNIAKLGGTYAAMTETATFTAFEPSTLATLGPLIFEDKLKGQVTTAHPQIDPTDLTTFNLLTDLSKTSHYQLYSQASQSKSRRLLANIPVKEPAYIHSFAMTQNYVILVECPFLLNTLELLLSGKPYIENYHWQGNKPTRFQIVEKGSGNVACIFEDQPCFIFHHVNAFEAADEIVIDAIAYDDATIVSDLYLDKLLDCNTSIAGGKLRRFRLNLTTKKANSEVISPEILELPRINDTLCSGTNYRYLYGTGKIEQTRFLDRLIKIDTKSESSLFWQEPHMYPGEPVFVNNPLSQEEDAGCLLSLVLDGLGKHSLLLVLDAQTMKELARITVPLVVPFGFHGIFIEETNNSHMQ